MNITPDAQVFFRWGFAHLNATILYTWVVMLMLWLVAWIITSQLQTYLPRSRWQNALEVIVSAIRGQIREVSSQNGADEYLPFVGTLFLFIAVSNLLDAVPGWRAPTGSLSTTAALAICVAVSVPLFGVRGPGWKGYLRHYLSPTFFMLPFHLMSEISRTVALAIRLFGNVMSESMIVAILLAIAPLFFPVLMQILGLLTGLIQAYIFAILAMVYIAAAARRQEERQPGKGTQSNG
jgi:F-type H+-transporting ATPase subunit a